jgi:hypothetical protein
MAIKISLQQLNESYNALLKLAQKEFPKDQHKLTYKLSRIVKAARTEAECLGDSLNDLMRKCGFEPGSTDATPDQIKDYTAQAKAFMATTMVELWGDPIKLDELYAVEISPFDLALLDWLIVDGEEPEPAPAAQGAKA